MGTTRTSEEILETRKAAMGGTLGELHFHLSQELARLHLQWKEFSRLFEGEDIVSLLNDTAPAFFGRLQQMWWESIFLHLTRMTDPKALGPYKRLSIRWLPDEIPEEHPGLKKKVSDLVDRAITATAFARDWRDRRLAHRDLDWTLNPDIRPLEKATKEGVEAALVALVAVLNAVEVAYEQAQTAYRGIITGNRGVLSLHHFLKLGRDAGQSK